MGIAGKVMWGKWADAATEKPDADILVLAYDTASDSWWISSHNGEKWFHGDMPDLIVPVTHWMHLPEGPL